MYQPAEDSYLIQKEIKKHAHGKVLDIGTGSGILAIEASRYAQSVVGIDVNSTALDYCQNHIKLKNVKFIESNLFSKVKGKFSLIMFNPPYLPADKNEDKDTALAVSGGKLGYELIEKCMVQANDYLEEKGVILLVFSSLTAKEKVDEVIKNNLFDFILVNSHKLAFEQLFLYRITKSSLLKQLNKKNITMLAPFAHGHRGIIFTAKKGKHKVAIKVKNPSSQAVHKIENEIKWLKVLNKHAIGPPLIDYGSGFFMYNFIEGDFIVDYIKKKPKKEIITMLIDVLKQCFTLDSLFLMKEEMHHPYKHIIINKKPVMIDFERMKKVKRPHNVTQFCQCLYGMSTLLNSKGFKLYKAALIKAGREYNGKSIAHICTLLKK